MQEARRQDARQLTHSTSRSCILLSWLLRSKYNRVKKALNILFLLSAFTLRSQDIHFSQWYMTPLLMNPAQAGSQNQYRAIFNYKNQWSSITQPYTTANFSYDQRLGKTANTAISALGLNVAQDRSGSPQIKTFLASITYACHIKTSEKSRLGVGLYAGLLQRSISYEGLQWMNQYDGKKYDPALASKEPEGGVTLMRPDVGFGLHYEYSKSEKYMTGNDHRKFNGGISVFHVNKPLYSFYGSAEKLYMKAGAYATAELGLANSDISLVPGAYYFIQGPAKEMLLGMLAQYQLKADSKYTGYVQGSSISFGGYYRGKDAAIAMALFKFQQYAIGLSYDVNVSKLKTASNGRGGFEISLRYVNPPSFLYKAKPRVE
jgi:type IX secretion system PorP/SprF family membrane protein